MASLIRVLRAFSSIGSCLIPHISTIVFWNSFENRAVRIGGKALFEMDVLVLVLVLLLLELFPSFFINMEFITCVMYNAWFWLLNRLVASSTSM